MRIAGQAVGLAADAYSVFQVERGVALLAHKVSIIAGAVRRLTYAQAGNKGEVVLALDADKTNIIEGFAVSGIA